MNNFVFNEFNSKKKSNKLMDIHLNNTKKEFNKDTSPVVSDTGEKKIKESEEDNQKIAKAFNLGVESAKKEMIQHYENLLLVEHNKNLYIQNLLSEIKVFNLSKEREIINIATDLALGLIDAFFNAKIDLTTEAFELMLDQLLIKNNIKENFLIYVNPENYDTALDACARIDISHDLIVQLSDIEYNTIRIETSDKSGHQISIKNISDNIIEIIKTNLTDINRGV